MIGKGRGEVHNKVTVENLREKTEEELLAIQRDSADNANVPSSIYHAVNLELQRRQQETNSTQISALIKEIRELKDITARNAETSTESARSSNRLAKVAILIAVFSLVAQVLFSTHQNEGCGINSTATGDDFMHYSACYRTFDLGLLGKYQIPLANYKRPINIK